MRIRALILVGVLQLVSALCPSMAGAENRALLIGASGYPAYVGPLRGPTNDMRAIWELLDKRGFKASNIRVLADRLPAELAEKASVNCANTKSDPDCPSYANIIRALDKLVAAAQAGDYVVLYFSGHGTQIPDLIKRDKPDGLREAFVPLDVGHWDAKRLTVENLLVSDLVGEAIEKMRAKGAFVWAVFDTCHAGDMVRGATDYATPRLVRGAQFGIPEAAFAEAKKGKSSLRRKGSSVDLLKTGRADGLVGFYATQSDQVTLELQFTGKDKEEKFIMGGLTYALRGALAQEPNATYRQLAERIVGRYGGFGVDMPAPFFEGDLDKPAFSDKAAEPIWQASEQAGKLMVTAGELDGLSEGAILAVTGAKGDAAAEAIGYARVELATANRSEAMPIAFADKEPLVVAAGAHLRARLERPGIRSVLRVALPPTTGKDATPEERSHSGQARNPGWAAIENLRDTPPGRRALSVEWMEPDQPADVYLRLRNDRIWLLTRFGNWVYEGRRQSRSLLVSDPEATVQALRENLWNLARAQNLQRVAGGYAQSVKGAEAAVAKALEIKVSRYRDPKALPGTKECPAAQSAPPKGAVRVDAHDPPELRHCDIVYVVMRNVGTKSADVTLLYIDADAQIQCFTGWGRPRIDPGEVRERIQAFRIVTMDPSSGALLPIGRERLMVIGVEKPAQDSIVTDFCHLRQKNLESARLMQEQKDRSGTSPFAALMEDAGLATEQSRGQSIGADDLGNVVMRTFSWEVRDAAKE